MKQVVTEHLTMAQVNDFLEEYKGNYARFHGAYISGVTVNYLTVHFE